MGLRLPEDTNSPRLSVLCMSSELDLEMKTWISVALLVFVCFFQKGDAVTGWSTPSITGADGTGTLTVQENQALTTTIATYAATGGTGTVTYSLATAVSPFAVAATGELTITAALDFETTSTYTLLVKAVDGATPAVSGTATITVTIGDQNEAPAFTATAFGVCILEGSGAGTTLVALTATDPDSGNTVSYSITSGNGAGDFTLASASSGAITVATSKTMAEATTPTYILEMEAADAAPLVGTATIVVIVKSACGASAALIASLGLVLMMSFITLLK